MAEEQDRHIKPFADWLALQRNGKLAAELADRLAEVNRAVQATGKSGAVTLKVTVKPAGDDVSVIVTDTVTAKVPEFDRGMTVFFVDDDGNPHRSQQVLGEHPANQPKLSAVPGASPVNEQTGEVL